MTAKTYAAILAVALAVVTASFCYYTYQQDEKVEDLTAQVEDLKEQAEEDAQDAATAEKVAFAAGVEACTQSDIDYFEYMAKEVGGEFGKLMQDWADNWTASDEDLEVWWEDFKNVTGNDAI